MRLKQVQRERDLVLAFCILHNFCYLHNDFIIQEIPDDDRHPQQQVLAVYNDAANAELAKQKRDDIARLLYRVNTKSVLQKKKEK